MDVKLKNYLKIRYNNFFETNKKVYISLDNGWFNIVNNCLGSIENYINELKENNNIYYEMKNAVNSMDTENVNKYYLDQYLNNKLQLKKIPEFNILEMKEKFGGLRIHSIGGDDVIRRVLKLTETISYQTCEVCGNKGKIRGGSWIKVLCDEHNQSTEEVELSIDKIILVAECNKLTKVKVLNILNDEIIVKKLDDYNEVFGESLRVEKITSNQDNYYIFK